MEKISTMIEQTAGYFIGLLAIITFAAAVLRYVFNAFIPDGFIIAQTLQGIAICWGFGTAIYADRHITVDILYSTAGAGFRRICDLTSYILNFLFMVLFAYASIFKVFDIQKAGEISDDLRFPLWIGYGLAAIGIVAALVMAGIRTWQVIVKHDSVKEGGGH